MKKRIVIVALLVCILVLSIASTTIAYFTDTKQAENVFTAGEVKIQLTEAPVKVEDANANGTQNIVKADGNRLVNAGIDYTTVRALYPGQTVYKDPTIENIGSEDAYVAAIIKVSGAEGLVDKTSVLEFLTGGIIHGADTEYYDLGNDVYAVYVIYETALAAKNGDTVDSVTIFDTVTIPAEWDNAEMAKIADLKITVDAYAVQAVGFANAKDAIKAAWGAEAGQPFHNKFN